MAIYFNIIIPIHNFFADLQPVLIHHSINIYVEKWNDDKKFHYELLDIQKTDTTSFSDKDFRGFFFTSLNIKINDGKLNPDKKITKRKDGITFYDDELFDYCIEGKGGRENDENIEIITLRIISKNPDKQIQKFYNSLQTLFKKSSEINKGLQIEHYFDDKIYYFKTDKNMLADIENTKPLHEIWTLS